MSHSYFLSTVRPYMVAGLGVAISLHIIKGIEIVYDNIEPYLNEIDWKECVKKYTREFGLLFSKAALIVGITKYSLISAGY